MSKVTFEVEIERMPEDKAEAWKVIDSMCAVISTMDFEGIRVKGITSSMVKTADDFDIEPHLKEVGTFIVSELDYAVEQWGHDIGNRFGIDECIDWEKIMKDLSYLDNDGIKQIFLFVHESSENSDMILEHIAEELFEHRDADDIYEYYEGLSKEY